MLFATLDEITSDSETPRVLADIAQVFLDASPLSAVQLSYPDLVRRLIDMARRQQSSGHDYYASISLHNAAIAQAVTGDHAQAIGLGHAALEAFDTLSYSASERYSTHAVLATSWAELGDWPRAEEHIAAGQARGEEHGDVPAAFGFLCARIGERGRAMQFIAQADALERQGLSDLEAAHVTTIARAFLELSLDPARSLVLISHQPRERPLDVGNTFENDVIVCLALLLNGDVHEARSVSSAALDRARLQAARSAEARFQLIHAIAGDDWQATGVAIRSAAVAGELALLELADVLAARLMFLVPIPTELHESITRWPSRWLPALRRQLDHGDTPSARAAALLLDEHGALEDVARLRAFAKTYNRRGRVNSQLGRSLARRVAPRLMINDLGRVSMSVGTRTVELSAMRRKPASLLMYLVTRPSQTATREQVLDELWPDTDPGSAANSLNQTLYFLRREIDPWYEDDVSIEYVPFEGDLLWLDPDLVHVESAAFLSELRTSESEGDASRYLQLLEQYRGHFAPEFEYEEWAMAWRTRLQVSFLEFAHNAVTALVRLGENADARDAAIRALEADPEARDIERMLIALYWKLGSRSAAKAQYAHFARRERDDGVEPPSFEEAREEPSIA